ncbi:TPA: AAA family ATPase [Vibrio parahaemolyticus]|uniref:ParA family protein n=1 Tax=Vibrio TaxID=662 RepID=UPI001121FFBE|nr:AAA family ATPase [Vibrio parahaemolyticus]EGR2360504.1 ParA family protein [Vibrio parahaemolyticus]EGR3424714.1 cobyrinic acid a,c-diamide synthase [Vibrio parahaemolyticus]EHH3659221.1 AAA family ATPase [Vibrio parahaemolyticus]MBE4731133.1 AAA family ATPase [Vibrio parahaemolyticus]MBE4765391.1 AAA family ATPase [Vibrio parahaemolyticus]
MKIISVINYKGGVGKTTVTANIAAELARRNKKVLLLDMDAQASLTFSFISPDFWNQSLKDTHTIKNYFDAISQGYAPPQLSNFVVRPQNVNNNIHQLGSTGVVDLISSHLGLINVDLELATLLGGANMNQAKLNYIKVHGKLRDSIIEYATGNYDVVLIDCPPNFNIVTKNALIASDQILIPAKPDYLSTLGIDYLHRSVTQLIREFNEFAAMDPSVTQSNPHMLGVVFTMIQIYASQPIGSQQQFITQTQRLGIPTFSTYFRENKSIFASAPQDGIPVTLHEYNRGTYSDVVTEINAFVDEFQRVAGV